jgi:hypothetical protein
VFVDDDAQQDFLDWAEEEGCLDEASERTVSTKRQFLMHTSPISAYASLPSAQKLTGSVS